VWTASLKEDGSITLNIGNLTMSAHPLLQHVFSAWKNNEAGTRYNLTGDAVRSYFQVLNDAPGYPFQYPMDSLPEKWGINAFFFKEGCLFAFTGEPLSLEMSQLFKRFAGVFGQTYTRFLDLQKAEAQAREAQIEAALERVRSKTMAMHSSHDIADTVAAMFDELIKIGIKNDVRSGISILSNPQEMEIWTGYSKPDGKVGLNIGSLEIASHPMLQRAYDLWVKKESHSTYTLTGEDQKNYYKAINNSKHYHAKFDIGSLPQKTIQNAFYFPEGFIHIFSHEQITDQEEQIFKRFAGVFGLTYRRFLDLEKAEAQAKEARIQTALERVRAAAMAMRTPGELLDICRILSNELNSLGFDGIRNAQIVVFDDKQGSFLDYEYYDEERNGISEVHYRGHPIIEEFVEVIRASGDVFMGNELTGEKLSDWKSYRNQSGQMPDKQLEKASALYYYWYSTELGALGLSAFKSILDDDLKILKRFRNVFDLAYSRYADITKAEAQAREAQIEAALERVRSRTLAMQKSDELAETAAVLFRQMISLGIEPNRLYIGITKEDTAEIEFWITDEDGSKVSNMFTGDANKNLSMKKMHDAWRANQKSIVIDMRGDELTEYLHYLGEILHVPFKGGLEQKRRVTYISFFSNGFIGMASPADQPQETIDLLDRFAYVFNLTYARFNDLKIAELHAIQAEQDLIAIKAARKNAEDALTDLRAAQKQLIQSEKMASLGELTAGIAHEIQNPLNFVNNFSEVSAELIEEMTEELDKGDIEEVKAIAGDIKDNLEKIRHHGKRADGIVKGMLQHSRTSSGQKEPTDLNALADEYLRLSYHGLRAKDKSFNAELVTNFDKGLPKISVIPQDMGRVILNLINNAFYATQQKQKMAGPDYKPTVEVKTKVSGDQALISVKDNGIGIPENIKDKILQPFFTTKPTGEGTGLGLSLSYDIVVKSHEGNILINSAEGNGSEFIINLPLKP
jgi:signal transduction histidine kinase